MRIPTEKRVATPAERRKRAVADQLGERAYVAVLKFLPADRQVRRRAVEKLYRLLGAFVADGYGEGALHCALTGAVVAAAPAFRDDQANAAAHAMFRRPEEDA